jgi:predicted regulator of Ras-like GTPase activity (Roadblock/LC7/MglB family)
MDPYSADSAKRRRKDKEFFPSNPDIQGFAVLSLEGLPIMSVLSRDVNDGIVSAMSAAILSVSERAVQELTRGELKRILIEGIDGSIILSKVEDLAILCTLVRSKASLGMVFLNIENFSKQIAKNLSGDHDGFKGDSSLPYPYIFKPPSPPGDLGLSGEAQLKTEIAIEGIWEDPYCKHCGSDLPKGQSICHVCGKKVI